MIKDDQEKAAKAKAVQNKKLSNNKPINTGTRLQAAQVEQLAVEVSGLKTQNTLVFQYLKQITTKLDVLMADGSAGEVHNKLSDDEEVTERKRYMLDSSQSKVTNSGDNEVDN